MKKPKPHGSMEGPGGLKALAKELVSQYALGVDAVRFAVVSFATDATTRVGWSYNATEINAGIDQMSADGKTSISDGFEGAGLLFNSHGRVGAKKVVLFVTDGEQSVDPAEDKTLWQTAVDAAALVKEDGATVFAWGFGTRVGFSTLENIATDPSKAILAQDVLELASYLVLLEAAVCNNSPPLLPPPLVPSPSPSPSPSPPPPPLPPPPPSLSPPPPPSQPPPSQPPPSQPPPYVFTSRDDLRQAAQAFNDNPADATRKYGPIETWDVSRITNMSGLFRGLTSFNSDVSSWSTSRVADMSHMFEVRLDAPLCSDPHPAPRDPRSSSRVAYGLPHFDSILQPVHTALRAARHRARRSLTSD